MSKAGTEVNVRYCGGSYTARGGGRVASATCGADGAVLALARKLGWNLHHASGVQHLNADHTRLVLHPGLQK